MVTWVRGCGYAEGKEGGIMEFEKAGGTRRRGGARQGNSKPVEPASGKNAAPSTLVDIDPWSALEKLWEQPNESAPASDSGGERKAGPRKPAKKPRSRRPARSS